MVQGGLAVTKKIHAGIGLVVDSGGGTISAGGLTVGTAADLTGQSTITGAHASSAIATVHAAAASYTSSNAVGSLSAARREAVLPLR